MMMVMVMNMAKMKMCDTRYSPLEIRIAILKHDIRRMVRSYTNVSPDAIDELAYLDKLVIDINVHDDKQS